ncbi:putative integral membrane protein [Brugia pahangi]
MKLLYLLILLIILICLSLPTFTLTINETLQWSNHSKNYDNEMNICRRILFKTDDKIFTLLAFPSLFISFNLIILSSYLFAITMTEVRNALLETEDITLQIMDSILVCLLPTNIMKRICSNDTKNMRYKKSI